MLTDTRQSGSITWETRTYTRERRWNGKCRACKAHHTALVTHETRTLTRSDRIKEASRSSTATGPDGKPWRGVACCGKPVDMKPVKGIHNDEIECGAKCRASKGHRCECSCGGKNHGAG